MRGSVSDVAPTAKRPSLRMSAMKSGMRGRSDSQSPSTSEDQLAAGGNSRCLSARNSRAFTKLYHKSSRPLHAHRDARLHTRRDTGDEPHLARRGDRKVELQFVHRETGFGRGLGDDEAQRINELVEALRYLFGIDFHGRQSGLTRRAEAGQPSPFSICSVRRHPHDYLRRCFVGGFVHMRLQSCAVSGIKLYRSICPFASASGKVYAPAYPDRSASRYWLESFSQSATATSRVTTAFPHGLGHKETAERALQSG